MVKGATSGDDIGKIFVGGLSHETTIESLKMYFQRFGEVTDCIVMRDPVTKKSRGFGFITFHDPGSVDSVVAQKENHILDSKTIDPKRAVPRGPGQTGQVSQQPNVHRDNNFAKVFVGGVANGTTEEDLLNYFSAYGKVVHVHLMYDNQPGMPKRMRGFGFVTFDSSQAVEKTTNIHFHQINGKTVEVKKAEQRESKMRNNMMGGPPSMQSPYQQAPGGPPGYGAQYAQQATYGMQHPIGMGRGYPGYGAVPPNPASAYGGGAAGTIPGYGYVGAPAVAGAGYGAETAAAMYGRGTAAARDGASAYAAAQGYGGPAYSTGVAPAQQAAVSAASGTYPDYSRVPVSQAGQPGAAAQAPHVDSAAAPDYSAYGLGNYQQQDLQYGPTRTSFSAEANYGTYGAAADPAAYGGGAAPAYGDSFGRGASASRGFHPYGR